MGTVHPVERFRSRLTELQRWPPGVVPVTEHIDGTAAFPAGTGLYETEPGAVPVFPFGGVMFLAHNPDAYDKFIERKRAGLPHGGRVKTMPYWRGIYRLLDAADVEPSRCYFTNAYAAFKAGAQPQGKMRSQLEDAFEVWCRDLVIDQITTMVPAVIVVMGEPAWRFAAALSPELSHWSRGRVDAAPVTATLHGVKAMVVPLLHPSGLWTTKRFRGYTTLDDAFEGEARLLRKALSSA